MKLELDANEVNLVLDSLAERPWKLVEPLIHKITNQVQEAQKAPLTGVPDLPAGQAGAGVQPAKARPACPVRRG